VLGGTFDPPHIGHLVVAQDVIEQLELDRLLVVPAGEPPHRETVLPAELRFRLVSECFQGDSRFEVSRVELERTGPSFTVDTLRWIQETRDPEVLYCVIGVDQLRVIDTWSRYEEIPRLARLAVMARGGEPPSLSEAVLPFETVPVTRVDVSGSEIRRRLREGLTIRYLVPERIRERLEADWSRLELSAVSAPDATGRPSTRNETAGGGY
jgi:nicotinate-nucleotide adenylyltransferase